MISKYRLVFRHLLKCKALERALSSVWLHGTKSHSKVIQEASEMGSSKSSGCQDIAERNLMSLMSALRARMLHFIQQLTFYMFFEVIEPQWNVMESQIGEVQIDSNQVCYSLRVD